MDLDPSPPFDAGLAVRGGTSRRLPASSDSGAVAAQCPNRQSATHDRLSGRSGIRTSASNDMGITDDEGRAHVSALDFWAFVIPAASFVAVTLVGQLIVSEVLMLAMLPWLWSARDRVALPRWFVVLGAGWLTSQIVTDIVVRSAFEDFTRGWAAIVFTGTDVAAILVLVSKPRRARLFAFGLAVGGLLGYLFAPDVYAVGDPWKFAFAIPVGLAMAAGLSGSAGTRRPWVTVTAFVVFGALNLFFGFRALGGVSLVSAGYLILRSVFGRQHRSSNHSKLGAATGLALLALAGLGVFQLYDVAASAGLLGADAQAKYEMQSGTLGVLVGGRTEILASSQAIIDSPILGHGSWAKDYRYVDLLTERLGSFGYEIGAAYSDVGLIPAHSYLMGSWVWAGFLGGLFWLAITGIAVRLLGDLYSFRADLAPLLVFSTTLLLWNIAFSPYGSSGRLLAAYGIALCILGLRLLPGDSRIRGAAHMPVVYPAPASVRRRNPSSHDAAKAGPACEEPT
jgi:hypothetical protein